MLKKNPAIIVKIVGHWFIFNCLIILTILAIDSDLPTFVWLNCSLFFATGLLSFKIQQAEKFNRDIFLFIGTLFTGISFLQLFSVLSETITFIPENFLNLTIVSPQVFLILFAPFTIIHFTMRYLCFKCAKIKIFTISSVFTIIITFLNYDFHIKSNSLSLLQNSLIMHSILFFTYLSMIFFMTFYAIRIIHSDAPTGEYLHPLMAGFFLWTLRGLINSGTLLLGSNIGMINEIHTLLNLLFIITILLKKLNYSMSDFGQFYEQVIYGSEKFFNINIKRRGDANVSFYISIGKLLFYNSTIIPALFLLGIGIQFSLNMPLFLIINFALNFLLTVLLFLFSIYVYQRRQRKGNVLNI